MRIMFEILFVKETKIVRVSHVSYWVDWNDYVYVHTGAENETEFHKKIAKYFWCFQKHTEKVICENTICQSCAYIFV